MKSVIDTSTLISLARISNLELIKMLKIDGVLPDEVYKEAVIIGEERGIVDATVIRNFITNNEIKVVSVDIDNIELLREKIGRVLAKGDEAVLALAMKVKAKDVITDDDGLGKIAMVLGFKVSATPDLLLRGLQEKLFDFCSYESFIRGLVIENRLSAVIAELYLLEGKKYVKG